MNVKKLALAGVSIVTGAAMFLPAASVGAVSQANLQPLIKEGNAVMDVQTELNCNHHQIEASITNKSGADIEPGFNLNGYKLNIPDLSIKPGDTQRFFLPYSGNDYTAQLEVVVDAQQPLKLTPSIHCNEPISFRVTNTSSSGMSGYLTNNSSFVGQTVFVRVNGNLEKHELLGRSESREIFIQFEQSPEMGVTAGGELQTVALQLGTPDGYQGSYIVDLNRIELPSVSAVSAKR